MAFETAERANMRIGVQVFSSREQFRFVAPIDMPDIIEAHVREAITPARSRPGVPFEQMMRSL
jgi:hypothetical protein